jgi:hypothetical protein
MKTSTILSTVIVAATAALTVTPALADRADHRQDNQARRIEQGVRSGDLSAYELNLLRREQAEIADLERRFERDGRLTPSERARLEAAQDRASRHIRAEKHDGEGRGPWWRGRWGYGNPRFYNPYYQPYRRWWR